MKWQFGFRRRRTVTRICLHCATPLTPCPTCHGHNDPGPGPGRICQHCTYGATCPTHTRHWTNP